MRETIATNCRRCHTLHTLTDAQYAEAKERFDTLANGSMDEAARVVGICNDCTMDELHWIIEPIGGNLRQYVATLDVIEGIYLRLMNESGTLPVTGACTLVYEENGEDEYRRTFPSFDAFLKWYYETEYTLPENGNGPEANGWSTVED